VLDDKTTHLTVFRVCGCVPVISSSDLKNALMFLKKFIIHFSSTEALAE